MAVDEVKTNTTVYDKDGNEYRYVEYVNGKHLVKKVVEVYTDNCIDDEDADYQTMFPEKCVTDNLAMLDVVYTRPPVQSVANEIVNLQRQKKELEAEIANYKETVDYYIQRVEQIADQDIDTLLYDRLKEVKNAELLVKALTGKLHKYQVTQWNSIQELEYGIVGVNLKTGEVKLFYEGNDSYYYVARPLNAPHYMDRETAELRAINNVNGEYCQGNMPSNYKDTIELNALFDKHGIQRSEKWKKHLAKIFEKEEQNIQGSIDSALADINRCNKRIQEYGDKLCEIKQKQQEQENG